MTSPTLTPYKELIGQIASEWLKGFEPVPPGTYRAEIAEADTGNTSFGEWGLKLFWKILGGPHKGRKIFDLVMLSGSDVSVAFSKRRLKRILVNIGHHDPNYIESPAELLNKPCLITVAVTQWQGEKRNRITKYHPAPTPHLDPSPPPTAGSPASSAARSDLDEWMAQNFWPALERENP